MQTGCDRTSLLERTTVGNTSSSATRYVPRRPYAGSRPWRIHRRTVSGCDRREEELLAAFNEIIGDVNRTHYDGQSHAQQTYASE